MSIELPAVVTLRVGCGFTQGSPQIVHILSWVIESVDSMPMITLEQARIMSNVMLILP